MTREHRTDNPSKIVILVTLILMLGLPYYLVKTFSGKQDSPPVDQLINLPTPQTNKPAIPVSSASWTTLTTQDKDSLTSLLKRNHIDLKPIGSILNNTEHGKILASLKPNQTIQLLINHDKIERLIIPVSRTQSLEFYYQDDIYKNRINQRKIETHEHYLTATVQNSLYNTAQRLKIPFNLIAQMTDIFSWDIDFAKDIRDGDRFTIIYNAYYIENQLIGAGEIVAVTLTNRNKTYQAIRHKNAAGEYSYFTPEGRSLKKAFDRYPLKFSHISSVFSYSRQHPVLNTTRPHRGIDLAAPIGTPVRATGDGRIATINYQEGYGNVIRINHYNNYATVYAHLLRYRKGLARGDRVHRGEIVGYVGQTGLATGPHLHYEFHLNKVPRNPVTVELPRGFSVPKNELASFQSQASTLLAHLKLYEEAQLAANGRNTLTG